MNLAICDDEAIMRRSLAERVKTIHPDMEIYVFSSAGELLKNEISFDIYLLDIEMEGISGMELAKLLRGRPHPFPPIIIFITGFAEHMADAFDVQAYHYLLKPLDHRKFQEVLNGAIAEASGQRSQLDDYLMIKSDNIMRKLAYDDIIYIESSNKQAIFHTTESKIKIYAPMNELEETLSGRFFRCHRGYLVNLAHVLSYEPGSISVTGGDNLLLSRLKYQDFVQAFMSYARSGGIVRV
ncbi:MAG: response regulator transcription factor [Lachnospiraceae bacterium]|nr:response regulator transcription factor [Lachnospiraceae bacterium]